MAGCLKSLNLLPSYHQSPAANAQKQRCCRCCVSCRYWQLNPLAAARQLSELFSLPVSLLSFLNILHPRSTTGMMQHGMMQHAGVQESLHAMTAWQVLKPSFFSFIQDPTGRHESFKIFCYCPDSRQRFRILEKLFVSSVKNGVTDFSKKQNMASTETRALQSNTALKIPAPAGCCRRACGRPPAQS